MMIFPSLHMRLNGIYDVCNWLSHGAVSLLPALLVVMHFYVFILTDRPIGNIFLVRHSYKDRITIPYATGALVNTYLINIYKYSIIEDGNILQFGISSSFHGIIFFSWYYILFVVFYSFRGILFFSWYFILLNARPDKLANFVSPYWMHFNSCIVCRWITSWRVGQ